MPATSELNRVSAIVLRYMRTPFLVLLSTYAIGITGMALMPGRALQGNMNLFHAFYFFTYSATTTGFGEIPNEFSDAQRLWATVCLYIGVIAWLYAIGSFIKLVQHPELLTAVAERRFARSVRRISEPYFIICGFGDTGSLLARGLSDNFCTAAVIDCDTERIKALAMRDYRVKMPGLCGDSSVPKHLIDAGVQRPNCRAVVALTPSDETNLKIAVMARSLNPSIDIVCRSTNQEEREYLEAVGDITIVDPYEIFSRQLRTAICTPLLYAWEEWLIGVTSTDLERPLKPPAEKWILCGYGRMGRALRVVLSERNIATVVLDPDAAPADPNVPAVAARASIATLQEAGVADAAGIVAGTNCDEANLGVLLGARKLNPAIFSVVRQNHHENELAFNGADANLIMQPSLITARRILLMLTAPAVMEFRDYLRGEGQHRVSELVDRTKAALHGATVHLWSASVEGDSCAVSALRSRGMRPTLEDVLRSPADRTRTLQAIPLILCRGGESVMLPDITTELLAGDSILCCGTDRARRLLLASLQNAYTLFYLHRGRDEARGAVASWIMRHLNHRTDTVPGGN